MMGEGFILFYNFIFWSSLYKHLQNSVVDCPKSSYMLHRHLHMKDISMISFLHLERITQYYAKMIDFHYEVSIITNCCHIQSKKLGKMEIKKKNFFEGLK